MLISYVTGEQDVQDDKPMGYEPLKFIPCRGMSGGAAGVIGNAERRVREDGCE